MNTEYPPQSTEREDRLFSEYLKQIPGMASTGFEHWVERKIDRLTTENARLKEALRWRKVEEEDPSKDGTHIIVQDRSDEIGFGRLADGKKLGPKTTVAHFFEDGFYPSVCYFGDEREMPIPFTHWLPIPEVEK